MGEGVDPSTSEFVALNGNVCNSAAVVGAYRTGV